MKLTKTQLDILQIAYTKGSVTSKYATQKLKFSQQYTSKLIMDLKGKGFLKKRGSTYFISDNIYSYDLRNLFLKHPKTNFKELLADSRMDVLLLLFDKKTAKRIQHLSGLSKPLVYIYLNGFLKYGVITKEGKDHRLNGVLWPDLVEFLESYSTHQEVISLGLPTVYREVYKNKDIMIFEVPIDLMVDKKTATSTAFSLFEKYGIALRLAYNYFCVPPQKLNISDIFAHALLCSKDVRKKTYSMLFYLKNKDLLDIQDIRKKYKVAGYLNKMNAILEGETLKEYPSLEEIKQKAELYDIKY